MAGSTTLLDFDNQLYKRENLIGTLQNVLSKYLPGLKLIHTIHFYKGGFLLLFTAVQGYFLSLRVFPQSLISIYIEHSRGKYNNLLSFEVQKEMEQTLRKEIGVEGSFLYPDIKHGKQIYFLTTDHRITELDIGEVVFEEQSLYQNVKIVHIKTYSNMLILKGFQNLSEKDLIYTEKLMQRGMEDYKNKEIIILGGGDGALLYELLKEKPKYIHMLELDEIVLKVCREQMEGCSEDSLARLEEEIYKCIVRDCINSLEKFIQEDKKVDYVFGDLTDAALSLKTHDRAWSFIQLIINWSMQVLKPSGKYMTHTGVPFMQRFEELLNTLEVSVEYTRDQALIPSIQENWVFFQVQLKENEEEYQVPPN